MQVHIFYGNQLQPNGSVVQMQGCPGRRVQGFHLNSVTLLESLRTAVPGTASSWQSSGPPAQKRTPPTGFTCTLAGVSTPPRRLRSSVNMVNVNVPQNTIARRVSKNPKFVGQFFILMDLSCQPFLTLRFLCVISLYPGRAGLPVLP